MTQKVKRLTLAKYLKEAAIIAKETVSYLEQFDPADGLFASATLTTGTAALLRLRFHPLMGEPQMTDVLPAVLTNLRLAVHRAWRESEPQDCNGPVPNALRIARRTLERLQQAAEHALRFADALEGRGDGAGIIQNLSTQPSKRLVFDDDTHTVTLDGEALPVSDYKAYAILQVIHNEYQTGNPVKNRDIQKQITGLRGKKSIPDTIKKLPPELQALITTNTNGKSLNLPTLAQKD